VGNGCDQIKRKRGVDPCIHGLSEG
jgi:hypothetical protein